MADIDKVINALECCYCNFPKQMDCKNCPYDKICYHDKACSLMLRDALALLKEQDKEMKEQEWQIKNRDESLEKAREEIKWLRGVLKEQEAVPVYEDKNNKCECGETVCRYWHPKFCGFCGKKLLWY